MAGLAEALEQVVSERPFPELPPREHMVNCVGLLNLAFGQAGLTQGVLAQLGGSNLGPSLCVVNRVGVPA